MGRLTGFALGLLDALCVLAALILSWSFWLWRAPNLQDLLQPAWTQLLLPNPWMPAGTVMIVGWAFAMRQQGMFDPGRLENSVRIASAATRAAAAMTVFTVVANFLLADRLYARGLVLPFLVSSWLFVLGARLLVFRLLLRLERPPTAEPALIVGAGHDAGEMAARLERDARHVCRVVGFVRTDSDGPAHVDGARVLGGVDDVAALVNRHDVGALILAVRGLPRQDAMKLALLADRMGLRVLQAPYSWGVVSPRLGFARVGGLDLIDLAGIRYSTMAERVKRSFDVICVLLGGAALAPLLLVVAGAIALTDGGPVLYASKRVGRGGRVFDFLKFRSMVVDADQQKDALRHLNESDGRLFKIRDDPRITPLGRFIRKYSIDELPQLWNVLRGEMNLVGPRPLPVQDLAGIESDPEMSYWFEMRHRVNPGITGLWQVSGRSSLGFAEMVRHDIRYIQDWSLWLDLQILLKTIPAVVRGRGAS